MIDVEKKYKAEDIIVKLTNLRKVVNRQASIIEINVMMNKLMH